MSETGRVAPLPGRRSVLPLLRGCSIRFTAYYWIGFVAGLAAVGLLDLRRALLAVPMWAAYCVGTESVNRIADRMADALNRPERTRLCEQVGWRRLTAVCWSSWAVFALIGAGLVAEFPRLPLVAMLLVDAAVAVGYSIGPAFKRHRVLALLALTAPLVTPLLTGWACSADQTRLFAPVLPAVLVLAVFSLGLAGTKDITDVEGDRLLGYRSLWLRVVRLRRGAAVYGMTAAPSLLVALFTSLGALPPTSLVLLPATAVSVLVVKAAARAAEPADREAAREVMHQYTVLFLAAVVLLCLPGPATAAAAVLAIGYWAVASRTLHWSGGPTRDQLRRWTALLTPQSRQGAPMDQTHAAADIAHGVREIVAEVLTMPVHQVGERANFYDDLGGDSMQKLEVIAHLEARFGCALTDDQAAAGETVEQLARQVLAHVA